MISQLIISRDQTHGISELNKESPYLDQSSESIPPLRHHQLTLLYRCKQMERYPILVKGNENRNDSRVDTRMGIIGDGYGSGKSYVILSLIMDDHMKLDVPQSHVRALCDNKIVIHEKKQYDPFNINIIIIPPHLAKQWEHYCQCFLPARIKYIVLSSMRQFIDFTLKPLDHYQCLVMTLNFYKQFVHYLHVMDLLKTYWVLL